MDATTSLDFTVEYHGSIALVEPQNKAAAAYLRWHTDGQWFGKALAVEPRYLDSLLDSLSLDGFTF